MSRKTGENRNCQTCGKVMYVSGWQIRKGFGKFCSLFCRRHTKEAKKKMSLKKVGKSTWNKGLSKLSDKRLNYFRPTVFKDYGLTPLCEKARKSAKARQWRNAVFERDDYTCQICGQRGGKLNADHIKRFSLYPELRFDVNNGRTLCEECHKLTNNYGNRGLTFHNGLFNGDFR